jgi:hypothetical protein
MAEVTIDHYLPTEVQVFNNTIFPGGLSPRLVNQHSLNYKCCKTWVFPSNPLFILSFFQEVIRYEKTIGLYTFCLSPELLGNVPWCVCFADFKAPKMYCISFNYLQLPKGYSIPMTTDPYWREEVGSRKFYESQAPRYISLFVWTRTVPVVLTTK